MQRYRDEIARMLAEKLPLKRTIAAELETPPEPQMGDLAFPCLNWRNIAQTAGSHSIDWQAPGQRDYFAHRARALINFSATGETAPGR